MKNDDTQMAPPECRDYHSLQMRIESLLENNAALARSNNALREECDGYLILNRGMHADRVREKEEHRRKIQALRNESDDYFTQLANANAQLSEANKKIRELMIELGGLKAGNEQRPIKRHGLKCDLDPFLEIFHGRKHAEFRKNDRDFQVGDILRLIPNTTSNLFSAIERQITCITTGYGIPDGYVMLSIEEPTDTECRP